MTLKQSSEQPSFKFFSTLVTLDLPYDPDYVLEHLNIGNYIRLILSTRAGYIFPCELYSSYRLPLPPHIYPSSGFTIEILPPHVKLTNWLQYAVFDGMWRCKWLQYCRDKIASNNGARMEYIARDCSIFGWTILAKAIEVWPICCTFTFRSDTYFIFTLPLSYFLFRHPFFSLRQAFICSYQNLSR